MELKLNRIYHMDCLEGLRKIQDEFIDLILTSPPYNLGNEHHTGGYRHQTYDDDMEELEYQNWQLEVLKECYRVLKPQGSLLYNHKNRIKNGKQITPYEWILKSPFTIKQEIVWVNRSQNFDKVRFYPWTERIYWLAKSSETVLENVINKPDVFDWKDWKPVGTRGKFKRAFPVKMVKDFLKVFHNADIILDPYMGSGSTAVGCKQLGRNYIGFEIEEEYVEFAINRLKKVKKTTNLRLDSFVR
ncbi:MAG: site-specific DNA-methyltransferase [Candidatus Lokiarchaeota archaeon]